MNIGIVCYASVGGSGIVATELGKSLAARGHHVHILSGDMPFRLGNYQPGLTFHRVDTPSYPLFREPQYLLSLATKIVHVARDHRLDIVHAHYAVPHATAACLARQVLASRYPDVTPRVVTTLHGTDITLLGADPSYSEIVAFGIEQSDGVTAVSESLARDTRRELRVSCDVRVIPNFIDCDVYRRQDARELRQRLAPASEAVLIHVSNFRAVKRVQAVVQVFARVRQVVPARLVMVGDGPDAGAAARLARELGVSAFVDFIGEQEAVIPLLSAADVFLLPSAQESFGLAALEAMACGLPVVASNAGGLPELIEHGVTGYLHAGDDLDGMASSAIELLSERETWQRVSDAASTIAHTRYCDSSIVPVYEAYYLERLSEPTRA